MACAMQHMYVSECRWTCWKGSLLLVLHLKQMMWVKASLGQVVRSLRTVLSALDVSGSWHVRVAWLDRPDAEHLLHDSEMTWRIFARCDQKQPPPHTHPLLLLCPSAMSFFPSFNTFGLAHFIFRTALLSLGCVFSWRDLIHSCNCSPSPTIMDNAMITGFQYTTNTFVTSWEH